MPTGGTNHVRSRVFFFQAEDGIRDHCVTGVQTCALPIFEEGFRAVDLARSSDADLLAHAWQLAEDVVEETRGSPGAADPSTIVLRQQRGFRRALQADTALAAVLGACDGDLDLRTIVATVAGILSIDPTALSQSVLPIIRTCIRDGFLG